MPSQVVRTWRTVAAQQAGHAKHVSKRGLPTVPSHSTSIGNLLPPAPSSPPDTPLPSDAAAMLRKAGALTHLALSCRTLPCCRQADQGWRAEQGARGQDSQDQRHCRADRLRGLHIPVGAQAVQAGAAGEGGGGGAGEAEKGADGQWHVYAMSRCTAWQRRCTCAAARGALSTACQCCLGAAQGHGRTARETAWRSVVLLCR